MRLAPASTKGRNTVKTLYPILITPTAGEISRENDLTPTAWEISREIYL